MQRNITTLPIASESLDNELKTGVLYLEILSQILSRHTPYKIPTVKNK